MLLQTIVSTLFFLPLLDSVPNHDNKNISCIEAKTTKLAPHTLSHMSCESVATLFVHV